MDYSQSCMPDAQGTYERTEGKTPGKEDGA